jgi:hypothetical protein
LAVVDGIVKMSNGIRKKLDDLSPLRIYHFCVVMMAIFLDLKCTKMYETFLWNGTAHRNSHFELERASSKLAKTNHLAIFFPFDRLPPVYCFFGHWVVVGRHFLLEAPRVVYFIMLLM